MTPEEIEALPADDLKAIAEAAALLHEAVPGVLDMQSPQDVEQQENLRGAMKLKLDEACAQLGRKVARDLKCHLRQGRGSCSPP